MKRRDLFLGAGLTALAQLLPRESGAAQSLLSHLASPQDLGTPLEVFDGIFTPNERFFVRSHFGAPAFNPRRKVKIVGSKQTLELSADDLQEFPQVTHVAVLQCAGNGRANQTPRVPGLQWVHGAMGQAEWRGVRLSDLLEKAGLPADAQHVKTLGADLPQKATVPAFVRSIPLARALDKTTIVATHMNGLPLPAAHGGPFRLVVPGWSGNHWMKWLKLLQPQAQEAEGFYQQTAYRLPKQPVAPGTAVKPADTSPATTFPIKSVIALPANGATLKPGRREIVGIAFSGEAQVAKVEVSLDGGRAWQSARLEGPAGIGRWQIFRLPFEAKPGNFIAVVRASDKKGNEQPPQAQWNPSGYFWNGWHTVAVQVAS